MFIASSVTRSVAGSGDAGRAVHGIQRLDRAVQTIGPIDAIDAAQDALRLAEGVAAEGSSAALPPRWRCHQALMSAKSSA